MVIPVLVNGLLNARVHQLSFYARHDALNLFVVRKLKVRTGGFDLGGEPRIEKIIKQRVLEVRMIRILFAKEDGVL